jgi:hypothetical protein
MKRSLTASAASILVAACAQMNVGPGTPEAQARGAFGTPAVEYDTPDGSRQLVYTTGPLGTQTFMIYVKGGTVQRVEQVLTDAKIFSLQNGVTTADEVRRTIGPPWRVVRFENLKQDSWDYRFRDTWGYLVNLSVMIDDRGLVASKVLARIESGRDGGMNR